MYNPNADAGKRPLLRIVPRECPELPARRVWRVAWRDAYARVRQEQEGHVDHAA
jgi:hypothetical protein